MRIMIDTNIIIAAAISPSGRAAQAFFKAITPPYQPIVCDYIVEELHRKFRQKFPQKQTELEAFLFNMLLSVKLVKTPVDITESESHIRDAKDRPILRAALDAHADLLLTGDKDFLESSITDPRIISAAEFLDGDFPDRSLTSTWS
ncbi:MAG: putative toxin-antitoxin system toxin component, PIN family [Eubacteriales bacterium]|nr:putative toxin-antitoxin system toxin component, PIN family [Eubacteriales bacterium]